MLELKSELSVHKISRTRAGSKSFRHTLSSRFTMFIAIIVIFLFFGVNTHGFHPRCWRGMSTGSIGSRVALQDHRLLMMRDGATSGGCTPITMVVTLEIKEDRVDDFLAVIEEDAIGSRTKENGGCLRFDVLKHKESSNRFTLYEAYVNDAAIEFHKNAPHYKLWTDFKASGGVVSQSVVKADGIFYTH